MTFFNKSLFYEILYFFNSRGLSRMFFLIETANLDSHFHSGIEISSALSLSCSENSVCYLFDVKGNLSAVPFYNVNYHWCHTSNYYILYLS